MAQSTSKSPQADTFLLQTNLKMTEASSKKCTYFNSGYCKFTNKDNDCKYFHPATSCQITDCKNKECLFRHPKKCRHGAQCRYRTKCMYRHNLENTLSEEREIQNNNDKTNDLQAQIEDLKLEIDKLKLENEGKVNALNIIHLEELEKSKNENLVFLKEIKQLQEINIEPKTTLASQEKFLNVTLAKNNDLTKELKENHDIEINQLKAQNEELDKKIAYNEAYTNQIKDIEHKGNDHKVKIKIEYDKLLNIISDKDKHINLQEQQIKELKRLTLSQNVT